MLSLSEITYLEYPGFSIIGGSQIHGKVSLKKDFLNKNLSQFSDI